jgi:hypothetical protein
MPTMGCRMGDKAPREGPIPEPLLWTVNDGAPLQIQIHDSDVRNAIGESDRIVEAALEYIMRENKTKVTYPEEAEFVSATPEAHRKSEKAYHVKAFKGSKDGMKRAILPTYLILTHSQATSSSFQTASFSVSRSLSSSSPWMTSNLYPTRLSCNVLSI